MGSNRQANRRAVVIATDTDTSSEATVAAAALGGGGDGGDEVDSAPFVQVVMRRKQQIGARVENGVRNTWQKLGGGGNASDSSCFAYLTLKVPKLL